MPTIRYTRQQDFDPATAQESATVLPGDVSLVFPGPFGYAYDSPFLGVGFITEADGSTRLTTAYGLSFDFSDVAQDVALIGGFYADVLAGGAGDDVLDGAGGADTLIGGAGQNFATDADAGSGVVASLNNPRANTGEAAGDVYRDIQGLIGSSFDDRLTTAAAGQMLEGRDGNDKLFVFGAPALVDGGAGRDTLYVSRQAPVAFAQGSLVDIEAIVVRDGASADFSAFDTAIATMTSTSAADGGATIIGTAGDDRIHAGLGADVLSGGDGNDRFFLTGASNTNLLAIDGGDGIDTVELNSGVYFGGDLSFNDSAWLTNIERLVLTTTDPDFPQIILALQGYDRGLEIVSAAAEATEVLVIGTSANDTIRGGASVGLFSGGLGADRLIAGTGSEIFGYSSLGEMEGDRILRFDTAHDLISVEEIIEAQYGEGAQFAYLGTEAFNGVAGAMRAVERANGVTVFQFDLDGDRVADGTLFVQSDERLGVENFQGVYLYRSEPMSAADTAIAIAIV